MKNRNFVLVITFQSQKYHLTNIHQLSTELAQDTHQLVGVWKLDSQLDYELSGCRHTEICSCYSQISKVTGRCCGKRLGAVAQSCEGLVTMISADGAVSCGLMISLILNCDCPGNTADLLWEDVHTLRGDAAVTVVPAALLLLVGTHQAVAAGQVVSDEGGGASVVLGVGGAVRCHWGSLVFCQQGSLNNAVCWQRPTRDLGCLYARKIP